MTAQLLVITAMLPQNVFSVWALRDSITLKEVAFPAMIRIAAMPIGIVGLTYVLTLTPAGVNQFVGAMILCAVVMQAFVGIEWKTAQKWYWILITFGGSGILQGLSGMSGPPMVLWVHGQRYSANRARAFLFSMYISNFLPQVLLLWSHFGSGVWRGVGIGLLATPPVVFGAVLGLRLGSLLGDRWLRPISYACLIAIAAYSLLGPWLRFLAN